MEIEIRTLLTRLNPACRKALEQAAQRCVRQTHHMVEVEHLVAGMLEVAPPDFMAVLSRYGLHSEDVRDQVQQALDRFTRGNNRTPALSPHIRALLQEAWLLGSTLLGQQQIRSGTVLLALLELDCLRGHLLESAPALLRIPRAGLREELATILADNEEGEAPDSRQADPAARAATPAANGKGALEQYTMDLTALARAGAIDPVRGRDAEIRQLIDVLQRRRQNSPILTGEAGVGKTAIVEGFAQRIVADDVPPALRGVSVRTLDLALLQAGAGVRGEFESRLKSVIDEVKASPTPVILFIDEAHQLIGAGGSEGQGDAANLLKPALARGELRTIAATTWGEYKRYVERDPALARRFQVVKVDEPAEGAAIEMLRGIAQRLEAHHGVEVLDCAVRDAVKLSRRYISGRQLPDKAISVLDTACARVAIGQSSTPEAIEELEREREIVQNQLRIVRRAVATGSDDGGKIGGLLGRLEDLQAECARQTEKLAAERLAVADVLKWRRHITSTLDEQGESGGSEPAQDESSAALTARLLQSQKRLEVAQQQAPIVPVYVDSAMVAQVISGWTGIPVGQMLADDVSTLLSLHDRLAERIIGQDDALDSIARRIRTFRADLDDPRKPVGVFLLLGPSGVGKTETAGALADILYGGEHNVVRINMSEFQEAHSVSKLKGAPPGYVGYGHGGTLTEAVRRRPYSVVLLDEMEKAHPDVLEMFFQVFDKGEMEDGEGVGIDFRNTLILLTSNVGQDVIMEACRNGSRPPAERLMEALLPQLTSRFSPAFLGRLVLVPYYPLGDAQINTIVSMKLEQLARRFQRNHHSRLTWDPAMAQSIASRCREVDSGARNVDHILTHSVLPHLAREVLARISTSKPFFGVHLFLTMDGAVGLNFKEE